MVSIAYLLPFSRVLNWVSAARREAWAQYLGGQTLSDNQRRAQRARQHLRQAWPQASEETLAHHLRQHFIHRSRLFMELGALRYGSVAQLLDAIHEWQGVDTLQQHVAQGRGVIVATPHFGHWERFNLAMGTKVPAAILYKPSGDPQADRWLRVLRSRTGVTPVPVTARGIREVYKRLRSGGIVGILPDQIPRQGRGVNAPFFGRPAYTMTLIHRLIQATGCQVMIGRCFAEKNHRSPVPDYRLRITPAPEAIYHRDALTSATALNQAIEAVVQEAPAQYLWTYKRWG